MFQARGRIWLPWPSWYGTCTQSSSRHDSIQTTQQTKRQHTKQQTKQKPNQTTSTKNTASIVTGDPVQWTSDGERGDSIVSPQVLAWQNQEKRENKDTKITMQGRPAHAKPNFNRLSGPRNGTWKRTCGISCLRSRAPMRRLQCSTTHATSTNPSLLRATPLLRGMF